MHGKPEVEHFIVLRMVLNKKENIECLTKEILCYATEIGIARPPPTTFVYVGNKELSAPVHRDCRGRTCGANLCRIA